MPRPGPPTPRVTPSQAQRRFVARLLRAQGWPPSPKPAPTPPPRAEPRQIAPNGDATDPHTDPHTPHTPPAPSLPAPPIAPRRDRPGSIPPFAPRDPASPFHGDQVLTELVRSVLAFNAGDRRAQQDLHAIASGVVDVNELRVSSRDEIADLLTGPQSERPARAELLRAALGEVFKREQRLALEHLPELEEAGRAFLQTLGPPPLPAYVSERTSVLALGLAGLAVDDRIAERLRGARLARQTATSGQIAAELLAAAPHGSWASLQLALELWADTPSDHAPRTRPKPRTGKAPTAPPRRSNPSKPSPAPPRRRGRA